ncbi:hypothetical protein PTKIN_Ptkin16aG0024500 [Pterospermum kingtungense]
MEIEKQREIKHWSHDEHPLVLVEEQSNQTENAYCFGCGEVVLGPCFSCSECKYYLHQKCAEAPFEIGSHPLHRRHSGFFLRKRPWSACALCKERRDMFSYECRTFDCWLVFDIKCAFLILQNLGQNFHEFKDDAIQHQFIFLENREDELKKVNCSLCHESLVDHSFYVSSECKIYLHKKCFEPIFKIDHPCHRRHTLTLRFSKQKSFCKLCEKEDFDNLFYHCFGCKFDIHAECALSKPINKYERYHEHPFTLFLKRDSFICYACGIKGNYICYICSICHLQLHKNCTSLPRIIKVARHNHYLSHEYFLKKRELEEHLCQICFDEVKTEYGSYQCLKEDCNYIAHVICATEDANLYYAVDQENQVEEFDENLTATTDSSISVIKVNEHGEATIVKHFYHEHNLLLEDKMKEDNGRNCDGCMLTISIPFYYCLECNFYLHKTCAELPKTKHHWFHRFVAALQSRNFMYCDLCRRSCSGLFYQSSSHDEQFNFCLRCAKVPNVIKSQGHEHFLFFDHKCRWQCNGCGVRSYHDAFRCKKCSFALDFACLTLPQAFQHKCDPHLLQLTYDDKNDDEEQRYCDICEKKRDHPTHWYYHCSTCDTSAHSECVLGRYPFFKDGITWPFYEYRHNHNLTFVRNVDGYPICDRCHKLCQDQTLKCSECNYFRHRICN